MIIYKEIYCECGCLITLEFNGEKYRGYCSVCDKEIIEQAYGDEQAIQEKLGR